MFRSRSRQGKCRKVISTFILAAFLCSVMPPQAYAAVDMGRVPYEMPVVQPRDLGFAEVDINTFTIPAHLGEVDYAFEGDSDQVVIHLQDAHCNPFAQHKISRIIEYLNNEYGIDIVNLEGGSKESRNGQVVGGRRRGSVSGELEDIS